MGIFKDLLWFFKQERRSYAIGAGALLVVSLLTLIPPFAAGRVVDGISEGTLSARSLWLWFALIAGTGLVAYILRFVWRIMLFGASMRLARLLRNRLYEHFTRMSPQFFHRRRIGDLMAHSTNDVQAVQMTAGDGVLTLVDSLSTGGVVIVMLFVLDWRLALLTLIPMPFMAWSTSYYGTLLHRRFHASQEAFSELNDKVQENVSGVRVIKAFGQQEAEIEDFKKLAADVADKNIRVARIDALFDPTIGLVVGLSFFLAIAFGAWFVVRGAMTLGELTSFTIYLGYLIWPMLAFGWLFNIVERGRASYDRIRSLLSVKADVFDREGAADEIAPGNMEYRIDTFTFPERNEPDLTEVQFLLLRGQTLGIVGKTGSGKTTLLRLLLREFDVTDGDVAIGGVSIYDVKLDALRRLIGYVPQDHFLFSASVAENIAFGRPDASRAQIEDAARIAAVHDDIVRFAEGYDTVVGERGITLSGGQKQRISIARAVLMDPEILILDDALSAVDAKTEKAILSALTSVRSGRTTMIATHRLSAVEHADLILVLDDGRIAERGTHAELMEVGGWYRSMYESQQLESLVAQGGGASHESN
ncbi:ABC transporter transmembrane domain-containing protein [Paenibacillus thermotolerans]|uniref:ABC transporter transmembrane domain-containing protein n=1 Tax=Paenibacillus thermotolerans TaxID=3027807 RepID=UPI002368CE14|nr:MULTISPECIES: ABC transporter transmembrane domain-containing protein [unclassified Paenibacillus]